MITTRRRRRRGPAATHIAGGIAGAAVLAAGLGAVHRLRRGAGGSGLRLPKGSRTAAEQSWQCACGQRFRVAGVERHRVYWLQDAPEGDPVMSGRCPACERLLPAGPETAIA
jgi:hypothetical protein